MALLLGTACTLYEGRVRTNLTGSSTGQGAPSRAAASRSHRSQAPGPAHGHGVGCYLLPRKPECLLATRVQEAQQAVL